MTGTLGILRAGAAIGLVELKQVLDRLRSTSFYISQELYDHLIADSKS